MNKEAIKFGFECMVYASFTVLTIYTVMFIEVADFSVIVSNELQKELDNYKIELYESIEQYNSDVVNKLLVSKYMIDATVDVVNEEVVYSKVGCNTNSMGLTLGCKDLVKKSTVQPDEILQQGKIYTYNNQRNSTYYSIDNGKNNSIVHRYVGCADEVKQPDGMCQRLIFKGDNNHKSEIVYRDQVTYQVVGVIQK